MRPAETPLHPRSRHRNCARTERLTTMIRNNNAPRAQHRAPDLLAPSGQGSRRVRRWLAPTLAGLLVLGGGLLGATRSTPRASLLAMGSASASGPVAGTSCTGSDLAFEAGPTAAFEGRAIQRIAVTTTRATPCSFGSSGVTLDHLLLRDGTAWGPTLRPAAAPDVVLEPATTGFLDLSASGSCPGAGSDLADGGVLSGVTIALGAARRQVSGLSLDVFCGGLQVAPLVVPELPTDPVTGPLVAAVRVLGTASSGLPLRYDVILTNTTDADYSFGDSCPTYTQSLNTGPVASFSAQLDCAGAGIPAGQSRSFAMTVPVPADATPGLAKLGWQLDAGAFAGSLVTVV